MCPCWHGAAEMSLCAIKSEFNAKFDSRKARDAVIQWAGRRVPLSWRGRDRRPRSPDAVAHLRIFSMGDLVVWRWLWRMHADGACTWRRWKYTTTALALA
jgi:hypothetical protein